MRDSLKFRNGNESLKDSLLPSKQISKQNFQTTENIQAELNKEGKENISSYLLLLALSIHACFEGIAIGLQDSTNEIFYMFLAISFHKWVEALSIGINLNRSKIERDYVFKYIVCFSLMTPLGIVCGMIFSGFSNIVEAVFLAISAGIYIFILIFRVFYLYKRFRGSYRGILCE